MTSWKDELIALRWGDVDWLNGTIRVERPTLRRVGVRWRRPYQTRHTYATNNLKAGVNPTYIARQMGHANAKMLVTVYARWIDGADRGRCEAKMKSDVFENNGR